MTRTTLLLAVAAGLAAPRLPAQQPLPTAAAVHARYVSALGGRDALARHTSRRTFGRFEVPAQGITGPIEIAAAAPDKMLSRVEIPGMGTVLSGFDGTTAWVINPAMGPMILTDQALEQTRQQADFHLALHPERWVDSMTVVGAPDFEGRPTHQVRVRLKSGEEYDEYYDRETGLLVGVSRTQASPMGDIPATSILEDYREFGGVRVAARIRLKMMGFEQILVVDSVSTAAIPDSVFALPEAIRALRRP